MAKVLIVYGSTTGNTETTANGIAGIIRSAGHDVVALDAGNARPAGLCAGYDCVLFGCSTWGDETIELQEDFIPLFDAFDVIGVSGMKFASFGCGDSSYTYYCGAVDSINKKLEELGGKMISQGLKIDGDPAGAINDIEAWAKGIVAALQKNAG